MSGTPAAATHDLPRERLWSVGPEVMADAELIAIVLGHAGPRVAHALVGRFRNLKRIADARLHELAQVEGVGFAAASRIKAALALAGRMWRPYQRGDPVGKPADVYDRLGRRFAMADREAFVALALDGRNRVMVELRLAQGGACSVEVVPRDLFSTLLREGATGVIFAHNHPSGDPRPSPADLTLTERLRAAGRLVGVRVVDHVVLAKDGFVSLADGWEKEES